MSCAKVDSNTGNMDRATQSCMAGRTRPGRGHRVAIGGTFLQHQQRQAVLRREALQPLLVAGGGQHETRLRSGNRQEIETGRNRQETGRELVNSTDGKTMTWCVLDPKATLATTAI